MDGSADEVLWAREAEAAARAAESRLAASQVGAGAAASSLGAAAAAAEHRRSFQKALSAGVKMALGSDISPMKDSALLELGLWVKCGATTWQALTAATKTCSSF